MDFYEWLDFGVEQGWVTRPDCTTHNGLPTTPEAEAEWEAGHDPCEIAMRVWVDNIY